MWKLQSDRDLEMTKFGSDRQQFGKQNVKWLKFQELTLYWSRYAKLSRHSIFGPVTDTSVLQCPRMTLTTTITFMHYCCDR